MGLGVSALEPDNDSRELQDSTSVEAEKSLLKAIIYDEPMSEQSAELLERLLTEEQGIITESEYWEIGLSEYLMQSEDINHQIWGLVHLDTLYFDRKDHQTGLSVLSPEVKSSVLNAAIVNEKASSDALILVLNMCLDYEFMNQCDMKPLSQRLLNSEPENLNVYVPKLMMAKKHGDQELMEAVLQNMSQTSYSRLIAPMPVKLPEMTEEYMSLYPVPNVYKKQFFFNHLKLQQKHRVFNVMMNSIHSSALIQSSPTQFYRTLRDLCVDDPLNSESCLAITDVLINQSDTVLAIHMGYMIKEMMLTATGTEEALVEVQEAIAANKIYNQCLMNIHFQINDPSLLLSDAFLKLTINKTHEGMFLEEMSQYLYDQLKGMDGLEDPRNCGFKYLNND